jgi:hypothetical protein
MEHRISNPSPKKEQACHYNRKQHKLLSQFRVREIPFPDSIGTHIMQQVDSDRVGEHRSPKQAGEKSRS